MRSDPSMLVRLWTKLRHSPVWRIGMAAVGWFVLISVLHFTLNTDRERRPTVHMGYMPVITNLAAPLLDAASVRKDAPVRFRAVKFASFAEMAEALRNDNIQAAFIIAPLSIVLHQQGADVRVVYIGHRHESTFVVRNDLRAASIMDLEGRTVAVPMRFSGHNLALLRLVQSSAQRGAIRIVEMNPPDMPSALAAGALDGYFVGEPFAAQSLKNGTGSLFLYVEEIWPDFICNLLLVRQSFIDRAPDQVAALVQGAVRSGLWAGEHPSRAAEIAARYWGHPVDLVEYALNTPEHRIVFDKYLPRRQELQEMADLMEAHGLIATAEIGGLVEDRFARQADLTGIGDLETILRPSPERP